MSESGARIYAIEHPASSRTLLGKLEELRREELTKLVSATDWPNYQKRLGVIEGLRVAMTLCEDIEKQER